MKLEEGKRSKKASMQFLDASNGPECSDDGITYSQQATSS